MTADFAARFQRPARPAELPALVPRPARPGRRRAGDHPPRLPPGLRGGAGGAGRGAGQPRPGRSRECGDGPPATVLGEFAWPGHRVLLAGFDAPMPYGPVAACVPTAMMPDEQVKADAMAHQAHTCCCTTPATTRTRWSGTSPSGRWRGRWPGSGPSSTLNEEARAAVPAFDLMPEDGEDILAHPPRTLPVPYLYGGFVKLDVGDAGPAVGADVRLPPARAAGPGPPPARARRHEPTRSGCSAGLLGYLRTDRRAVPARRHPRPGRRQDSPCGRQAAEASGGWTRRARRWWWNP